MHQYIIRYIIITLGGTVLLDFESVRPLSQTRSLGLKSKDAWMTWDDMAPDDLAWRETVYRRTPPYDGPEFADVHRWAQRLIGLAVLPVQCPVSQLSGTTVLQIRRGLGDAQVDANLLAFRD